jgi:uncharacterized repeat protein (TIGR01451 family)
LQLRDNARTVLYGPARMRHAARRGAGVLAVLGFVVALAAWPGVALANLTVTGATIDGVSSTSGPPGSVFGARVTGMATAGETWRGTQYQFGSNALHCVDTNDGQGNHAVNLNVTAPGDSGKYDLGFTARGQNNCSGDQSPERMVSDALTVTAPADNPNLPPRCGINVMLVLDKSGSIKNSGQTETVRDAARTFLQALSGTGSKVSIVDFSTTAAQPVGYTTVTPESIASTFEPYLANKYNPDGWTNWEDAFKKVRESNTQGTRADLVVFVTDGDPTAHNNAGKQPTTGLTEGDVTAMRPAALEADLVKGQGSHVFMVGVGSAVTKPTSASRLTAVSGFDRFPPTEFSKADYTLVENFDDLAAALRKVATELCQASVTVTKLVDEGNGTFAADPGWKFTATVSTTPGGFEWLQPANGSGSSASETTNDEGVVTFQWKPSKPLAISTVTLDEATKPGYAFVDAICTSNAPTKTRRHRIHRTSEPVKTLTLKPNEYYKCTVRNRIKPGTIEIEKRATPQSSQKFDFTGSPSPLENFTLVDDGKNDADASRIFSNLPPGKYTVSEMVPGKWKLSGVSCTPDPGATTAISGGEVTINLAAGGSTVCTYSDDLRVEPPAPPQPPPPSPPGPGPSPPAPPPTPLPSTQIRVVKTAPRVARAGQRVRFTLTVTNVGSVAARGVWLGDVPPAAVKLRSFTSATKARVVRGYAIWHLGRLAPGAKRTIRGSVRIAAGTPGLKRNIVMATALNAKLASDHADTRLLRPRRAAPPVTG